MEGSQVAKRVTAVLGDFYHRRSWAVEALESAIQPIREQLDIEYRTVDQLVESLASKPDAVILFAENRINPEDEEVKTWMDDDAAVAISSYVENGGGWLAWHSGMASYEEISPYTSMLHGYFKYHPTEHQHVTYYPEANSDLIEEGDSFTIIDEHYFVECDQAETNVFLTSKSVDGSSIAGWYHDYGKGHVLCLAPAHLKDGLMHPTEQKLVLNAVKNVCFGKV